MKATYKSKPIPHVEADVAAEQSRRESLAVNAPLQRGVARAEGQEKSNRRGEITQRLADLNRVTLKRDTTQAGRDSYDRTWNDCFAKAQRFADAYGEVVEIPEYLGPPVATAASVLRIEPRAQTDGRYHESKGMRGGGLPLFGPGSNVDPAWLDK